MFLKKDPFINIHSHFKPRFPDEIVIRNAYLTLSKSQIPKLSYPVSLGLHPWHLHKMSIESCIEKLSATVVSPNVMAVGEIGIDRAIDTPISIQSAYFEAQLNIAEKVNKPVIIHAVHSYSDLIPYLKKSKVPFIFHQFNGNELQAKELLQYSCKLSFGINLLHPKSHAIFRTLPNDSFFLETDVSGNYSIRDIYAKAAEIRQMEQDVLKDQLFHTFAKIFAG
jgi:TatD DNase family protein